MNGTHYTASDIERYHSGELSAAERHALEKAALDDPFLADALEGYALAQTPAADLDALQQRLQQRIEEANVRRGFFSSGWLRIAALFVVVAGGGWLALNLFSNTDAGETLARKSAPAETQPPQADSFSVATGAPKATTPFAGAETDSTAVANNFSVKRKKDSPGAGYYKTIPPAQAASPALQEQRQTFAAADSGVSQALSGRVNGLKTEEEKTVQATEVVANKAAAMPRKDTVNLGNITLKPDNTGLNEVVVTSAKRKQISKERLRNYTVDSLEPAEGWTNFDDYIANNLKVPEDKKKKEISGEVELSFDVNSEGEPVNIVVTKSLCLPCDAEAMRLLKEGPKWKGRTRKGKVKIRF